MLLPRSGHECHRSFLYGHIQLAQEELAAFTRRSHPLNSPNDLMAFEQQLQQLTQRLHALLAAKAVQDALLADSMRQQVRNLLHTSPKRFKNQGWRPVSLRFAQGPPVVVFAAYHSRGQNRSGKRCKGFFPALLVLGIHDHCSPSLASAAGQLVALLGSFAEAQRLLKQRGCTLCVNTLRRVAYRYCQRVRLAQKAKKAACQQESLQGRLVVLTCDGGRIRIRKDRKAKTKKGRKRYSTSWREPKLLMIYVVKQDKGEVKMDEAFAPVLDGTLKGPDAVFALFRYYLEQLHIDKANRVLFVADGAAWIWKRVGALLRALHVDKEKRHELVDFYHAMQHLSAAAVQSGQLGSEKVKKKWLKEQSKRLLSGKVEEAIEELERLGQKCSSKAFQREVNYFVKHGREHKRMEYGRMKELGLPLGSGAIESAMRRVVNLRLKGATLFWHKDSAEAVLLLRCFAKSRRFQNLDTLAFTPDLATIA
jgi:hypothetical protein